MNRRYLLPLAPVAVCLGLGIAGPAWSQASLPFAKAFNPGSILAGGTSNLLLAIDNINGGVAVTNLAVIDNLPAGMVVANPSNAATTCTGGTLTAVAGSGTITYTGGSLGANAYCEISVDVTVASAGTYVNTTGDLTSSLGNSGPATATLLATATPPPPPPTAAPTAVPGLPLFGMLALGGILAGLAARTLRKRG